MRGEDDQALVIQDLHNAPCPKEIQERWQDLLLHSRAEERSKRAVYRAAVLGESWLDAAESEGLHPQALWRLARRYGLAGRNQQQLTAALQRLATLSADQLEKMLIDGDLKPKDVAVALGISTDKLVRQLDRGTGERGYQSFLDQIASQLQQGGTVSFQLTVEPADPAIDVSPEPD